MAEKPRCDLDAEAAVLSAALLSQDAALEALEILRPEDFYADANRQVFSTVLAVLAESSCCDPVSVAAKLRATGRLEQIGGTPYLAQLSDATPAVAHVAEHARVVRDLARVRRAGLEFARIAAEARASNIENVSEWLESCEARACAATYERGSVETAADYRTLASRAYEEISTASKQGKPTLGRELGFQSLDRQICGLEPGAFVVIAGRPGKGKTAFAMQVLETMVSDVSLPGLGIFFSLEMTKEQLMMRSLARVSSQSLRKLRLGQPSMWSDVTKGAADLASKPIIIDDDPNLTPLRLRAKIRRHSATLRAAFPDLALAVIVVDYIQLMSADVTSKDGNRVQELSQITRALKLIAKEFKCTVIGLSQLRRAAPGKTESRPELSDLRDSGSIEQDADIVIAIHHRTAKDDDRRDDDGGYKPITAELILLKGRSVGEGIHLAMFDGLHTRFIDDAPAPMPHSSSRNGGGTNGYHHSNADQSEIRYP